MTKDPKLYWPISQLKPWDKNPRDIRPADFERLKKQITELGEYKPLIITPIGDVIGGNMRFRAYQSLGFKECWVSIVSPKNEAEKIKYALSDNDRAGYYLEDELVQLIDQYRDDIGEEDLKMLKVDLRESVSIDALIKSITEASGEDKGEEYKSSFQVVVECKDEAEQKATYDELIEKGYECKVLTL